MEKSKWYTVKNKLILVEGWTRDGLTDEQIANNLCIHAATLYRYKNEHSELCEALKRGKQIIDFEVESALLKRALEYSYTEVTTERVLRKDEHEKVLTDIHGFPIYDMVITKEVKKEVIPDTTAQIFWLKNRKPKQWKDKQDIEHTGNIGIKKLEDFFQNSLTSMA